MKHNLLNQLTKKIMAAPRPTLSHEKSFKVKKSDFHPLGRPFKLPTAFDQALIAACDTAMPHWPTKIGPEDRLLAQLKALTDHLNTKFGHIATFKLSLSGTFLSQFFQTCTPNDMDFSLNITAKPPLNLELPADKKAAITLLDTVLAVGLQWFGLETEGHLTCSKLNALKLFNQPWALVRYYPDSASPKKTTLPLEIKFTFESDNRSFVYLHDSLSAVFNGHEWTLKSEFLDLSVASRCLTSKALICPNPHEKKEGIKRFWKYLKPMWTSLTLSEDPIFREALITQLITGIGPFPKGKDCLDSILGRLKMEATPDEWIEISRQCASVLCDAIYFAPDSEKQWRFRFRPTVPLS